MQYSAYNSMWNKALNRRISMQRVVESKLATELTIRNKYLYVPKKA